MSVCVKYKGFYIRNIKATWSSNYPILWYAMKDEKYLYKDNTYHDYCDDDGYWESEREVKKFIDSIYDFITEKEFKI